MPRAARDSELGSALLLVPALLLVLLMASTLAVDAAIGFAAKRDLAEAAAAAANDAAAAIDDEAFYRRGELLIDEVLAQHLASAALAGRRSTLSSGASVTVMATVLPTGEPGVEIIATGQAHLLFARILPGRASTIALRATARAAARLRQPTAPEEP